VPPIVVLAVKVSVLAASPIDIDFSVRPAVNNSLLAKVKSKAAPVDLIPSPVNAVCEPPAIAGATLHYKSSARSCLGRYGW